MLLPMPSSSYLGISSNYPWSSYITELGMTLRDSSNAPKPGVGLGMTIVVKARMIPEWLRNLTVPKAAFTLSR